MNVTRTNRGFEIIEMPSYPSGETRRLIQASSAIGDYKDSMDVPGSSYLWVGQDHHLDREQVKQLIAHLRAWLKAHRLELDLKIPSEK